MIGDATGKGDGVYGNMFVPIDALPPILADLMSLGRVSGPGKPWHGVENGMPVDELIARLRKLAG